jgi:hypothetical protein
VVTRPGIVAAAVPLQRREQTLIRIALVKFVADDADNEPLAGRVGLSLRSATNVPYADLLGAHEIDVAARREPHVGILPAAALTLPSDRSASSSRASARPSRASTLTSNKSSTAPRTSALVASLRTLNTTW